MTVNKKQIILWLVSFIILVSVFRKGSGLVLSSPVKESVFFKCKEPGLFALTFDDGPRPSHTNTVLDMLQRNEVKATFFINGQNWDDITHTDVEDTLRRMKKEGHQIASHTWRHANLTNNLTAVEIHRQVMQLHGKVFSLLGINMHHMRPPFGEYNHTVVDIISKLGYKVVMWNLSPYDWRHPGDTEAGLKEYRKVMNGTSPVNSSFVALHHDTLNGGTELAQAAIDFVKLRGYKFVTVNECLG